MSWACREVLIKAVAQAIPTYAMSVFKFSTDHYHSIQFAINCFWWGHKKNYRKIHWLGSSKRNFVVSANRMVVLALETWLPLLTLCLQNNSKDSLRIMPSCSLHCFEQNTFLTGKFSVPPLVLDRALPSGVFLESRMSSSRVPVGFLEWRNLECLGKPMDPSPPIIPIYYVEASISFQPSSLELGGSSQFLLAKKLDPRVLLISSCRHYSWPSTMFFLSSR